LPCDRFTIAGKLALVVVAVAVTVPVPDVVYVEALVLVA
jgi:hypothetical protein